MRSRRDRSRGWGVVALGTCALAGALAACTPDRGRLPTDSDAVAVATPAARVDLHARAASNRFAYIPPQCYTKTRDGDWRGDAHNPCFVCHRRSEPPNFVNDGDLQLRWSLPAAAAENRWTNVLQPPRPSAPVVSDAEVLAYVRRSNYRDFAAGALLLPPTLDDVAAAGKTGVAWRGYRPDAWFSFDTRGFDHRPDGKYTGWRALAYYPFPGAFFPTNGSADDVLIRLDPALRENDRGDLDLSVYAVNLAIVEALIKRADVPIDVVDETVLGVDLDHDGHLGEARRVVFDAGERGMQYVGRARGELLAGRFPIAPGLLPRNTEFLHSVRYLDVDGGGVVKMAARMKELRYARKIRFLSARELQTQAARESLEQRRSLDGVAHYGWELDQGAYNGQGWLFQGFIEATDGALRPQSYEETLSCVGCHGGIGATTDSVFALRRKLGGSAPARGWFHWNQRDLRGFPEPVAEGGAFEYSRYLEANGAADELRENAEAKGRFFDARGALRQDAVERLHHDVAELLLPSAARAIALDRAYMAIVAEQSFAHGRAALLSPGVNVHARAPVGEVTGIIAGIDVGRPEE